MRRAHARFGVGDARECGLFGFLECGKPRGANGLFPLTRRGREQVLHERTQRLIDGGSKTIFERHVMSRPGIWVIRGLRQRLGCALLSVYCKYRPVYCQTLWRVAVQEVKVRSRPND